MSTVKIRTRLKETADTPTTSGNKFKVILIQEGLGNLKDCFYYTKESLQASPEVFEGKKCYADHPSSLEEQVRPERSTRDIIGYFEQVQFEEVNDRGALTAILCLVDDTSVDWARALLTNSLEYAKKYQESDFVGLSINANGEANPIGIDEFIQGNQIPESVMSKLDLAKQEGISEIRIVSNLKEAVSCDLVTEAGAGGKILKMIEGKKSMKQKKHEAEAEGEAKMKHAALMPKDQGAAPADKGSGQDAGHDDAGQDKALFAKMIKQYLGDDHGADESEAMEMGKHAYEAYQAEGMEANEAYEAAGKHMKMALAVGKKMHQGMKQSETEAEGEAEMKHAEAEDDEEKAPMPGKKKESNKLMELSGEVAKLRESVKKYELRDYLEAKLSKSKKSNSITKAFREALGTPKSKAHIDETYNLFMKAVDARSEEVEADSSVFFTEKQSFRESDGEGKIGSLSDCVK